MVVTLNITLNTLLNLYSIPGNATSYELSQPNSGQSFTLVVPSGQAANITCYIDNSRTGLDTSKNQCSAPAVTALKKY